MKYSSLNLDTNNEVFDEFLRIAEDKVFKVVQEGNEHNVKDMKDLYDVSVDDQTGKELLEKAHPEKGETIESYLTDGGLVENQTKQQETDMSIALKSPNGKVYKKTMAAKELADELVIIAEEMDVRGNTELASYADNILFRLEKTALVPLLVPILGGVAAIIGSFYALAHQTDPVNFGVDTNLQSLVLTIKDYKDAKPESADVSVDVLSELNTILSGIYKTREQYKKLMSSLSSSLKGIVQIPSNKEQLSSIKTENVAPLTQNKEANELVNKINQYSSMYSKYISDLIPELNRVNTYLKAYFSQTKDLAKSKTGERGVLTQIWEKSKEYLGKTQKSVEDNLLDALSVFLKSLVDDLRLRTAEKDQLVNMLTSKVKYDISEKFDLEATPTK